MTVDKVYCLLCNYAAMDWDDIVEHIRVLHPEYWSDPERWPDGRLVIVDETLEAEDFTKST